MPTGKPSAVPSPQRTTPAIASGHGPASTAATAPIVASTVLPSSTGTRPHRSSATVPAVRPSVIEATKTPKATAPTASVTR
ncbi:hypothetical protein Pen02_71820 [Plantactinospora endophytica]|uniref:Uncharacterized protein n=1 Tax=Plantactinospora endophytica TaxID=673535 RepID=A0ABQ4EBY2_9ACTN|nr:hypothetical protein Pen02_71820 [Plantactinospora endophytica]